MNTTNMPGTPLLIHEALDISTGSIAAVVGCGGKTSLIELLAKSLADKRVLVSPTTKMFPMKTDGFDCVGVFHEDSGKLGALPGDELAALIPQYDMTLLEADGSKGFFAKGWQDDEPVIPDYCTHTVGVVTLRALGLAATGAAVHRLPEFLSLTGLHEGEIISAEALSTMVCAPRGMFKNSVGRRFLIVNQVESEEAAQAARSFLTMIKKRYPGRFERHIYGSIRCKTWLEV